MIFLVLIVKTVTFAKERVIKWNGPLYDFPCSDCKNYYICKRKYHKVESVIL